VDADGKPLTNLITWADNRSIHQAEDIKEHFDYRKMYQNTGCRTQHPMYPVSKILWLKETQPELYQKAHKFITIKEYILWKLFGEYVIDITDASTTGCFNIHSFQWDDYSLRQVLELDIAKFGEPVDCLYILKKMKPEYAAEMGIDPLTPVMVGSGDGMLANLACGVVDNTSMSCTIGTSGALRVTVPKPLLDPEQRTWCYCFTRDSWVAGGAINNGGIVLKWLRDNYREQFRFFFTLFDRRALPQLECSCQGVDIWPPTGSWEKTFGPGGHGRGYVPDVFGISGVNRIEWRSPAVESERRICQLRCLAADSGGCV
jgi:gluconokinase